MRIVTIIQQSHVGLLFENGVFVRELGPGRHVLGRRIFDRVERKVRIVQRHQLLRMRRFAVHTNDRASLKVELALHFEVQDFRLAFESVYRTRIETDIVRIARSILSAQPLSYAMSHQGEFGEAVREYAKAIVQRYGLMLHQVDLIDLGLADRVEKSLMRALEAQHRVEADVVAAEARRQVEAIERQRALIEANALEEHPQLARVFEIEALRSLAKSGARVTIGLDSGAILKRDRPDESDSK